MLRFEDLRLERIIFEVKFRDGYLYWDRCGKIWREIGQKWPELEFREVTPDRATLVLSEQGMVVSFSHQRFGVHQDYPGKLDFYKEFSDYCSQIVLDTIEVKTLSRVGSRFQYISEMKEAQATELLQKIGLFASPKNLSVLGKRVTSAMTIFVIEREDLSMRVQIGHAERELQISVPRPLKIDLSPFAKEVLLIDIDCFLSKPTPRGILETGSFINAQEKNVRRAIENLLE